MKLPLKTTTTAVMLLFSAGAFAVPSTLPIQLQWQGVIPLAPSTTGAWKYVNPVTGADYVATMGVLNISGGAAKRVIPTPTQIGLQTTTGGIFTASTDIKAFLAADPTYIGLTGTTAPAAPTMSVNGVTLTVGAANSVTVGTTSATPGAPDIIPLTVTGNGQLAAGTYNDGDAVILTTSLMITADVT
ncbi:hypothetical protein [Morganella psychrotolerans]|uniref:hypothetical protein n=1 Tax=Morganella psychrotolerans TaxID=368603 RepID=UPI0039AFE60D